VATADGTGKGFSEAEGAAFPFRTSGKSQEADVGTEYVFPRPNEIQATNRPGKPSVPSGHSQSGSESRNTVFSIRSVQNIRLGHRNNEKAIRTGNSEVTGLERNNDQDLRK
jgi:hypothetical protein